MKTKESKRFLELAGVSLRVGGRLVFRNTHWVFARDQHWVLVGPNSSGKTLLACALAGEIPVIGGEIVYSFRLPGNRSPEEAISHVSFEQHKTIAGDAPAAARWFDLEKGEAITVRQFLSQESVEEINPFVVVERSPAAGGAFERRRRRFLRLLQIERLQDRLLPSLSNGEMHKTLLARALLRRPRLLILDDPFTGLDAQFRIHLKGILEKLMREKGVRILLIANRRDELPRGITHLLCVDRCRVVARGNLKAMLADPHVRRLLPGGSGHSRNNRFAPVNARGSGLNGVELVRLEKVSVRYEGHAILEDISWVVMRGESWALLGPNGSGKSTLLSLIVGDNPQAYANAVYVFGRRRGSGESVWELKQRIGWVSPELHLHFPETQTCLETVVSGFFDTHGCYRPPTPRHLSIARQWLAALGLAGCTGRPFGSLSAGLQRMTLLARALVKSPELLVLDEPCQGLDYLHRKRFLRTIQTLLQRMETTAIYITHRQDELPEGIHRVLRLRNGRVDRS